MIGVSVSGWATGPWVMEPLAFALGDHWGIGHSSWEALLGDGPHCDPAEHLERLRPYEESRCLIGWSLGAMLAIETVLRRPGVWDHLILIAPTLCMGGFGGVKGTPESVLRAMRLGLRSDRAGILRAFARLCLEPEQGGEFEERMVREGQVEDNLEPLDAGLDYLLRTDLTDRIQGLEIACTVISGREDRVIPWRAGEETADRCGGSFHLLRGSGHALPWTAAGAVARIIRDEVGE